MDLAVLAAAVAGHPLAVRSASSALPFDLAQACAAHGLTCATVDAADLPAPTAPPAGVDVLIVAGLARASRATQARAVDLLRGDPARRPLLFVALLGGEDGALTPLLNDLVLLEHAHHQKKSKRTTTRDDEDDDEEDDARPRTGPRARIAELQSAASRAKLGPETLRYAHDIVTHLRLHRAVAGGVSATAGRQMVQLARVLAALNGLGFVTPALVGLAARQALPHRLRLAGAAGERSVQWGSDVRDVAARLAGVTAAGVVEEVLLQVDVPL